MGRRVVLTHHHRTHFFVQGVCDTNILDFLKRISNSLVSFHIKLTTLSTITQAIHFLEKKCPAYVKVYER